MLRRRTPQRLSHKRRRVPSSILRQKLKRASVNKKRRRKMHKMMDFQKLKKQKKYLLINAARPSAIPTILTKIKKKKMR